MSIEQEINFTLNSGPAKARVPVTMDTLTMLRGVLRMTGTKYGCGEGECGACTILVDGTAINSCLMFAVDCDGRALTTIEGVQTGSHPLAGAAGLSDLQHAFVEHGAAQCGFCTPGLIMQGMWLVNRDPNLSAEQIKRGIEGNLCRCTGYTKVIDAIASTLDRNRSAAMERT